MHDSEASAAPTVSREAIRQALSRPARNTGGKRSDGEAGTSLPMPGATRSATPTPIATDRDHDPDRDPDREPDLDPDLDLDLDRDPGPGPDRDPDPDPRPRTGGPTD
ncbi:MAG TPA: hypothetical protein VLU43_18645 [Anaeromyxobacteraceae bacterium]|nr:hypothetical protein [Anaeromyxobacteraceae bacterium]